MKRALLLITIASMCLAWMSTSQTIASMGLSAHAQTALQIVPDQSVGVLSEDPGSGERWSTSVLPFGNYVGTTSGNDIFCRTYLQFPLGGIPAGATLHSATLHVYVDDFWPGPGGAPMSVYRVAAAWTPVGVGWNDMGNWPALAESVSTGDVSSTAGWYDWDVTSLVQGWLDGTPNSGLALAAADLGAMTSNWAAARRLSADDPATRPYLDVTYSEPTPTSTPEPPPTSTPEPPPPATATSQPPIPTATPTPIPTYTPAPVPVLLPATGGPSLSVKNWMLGIGTVLGVVSALAAWGRGRRGVR